MQKTIVQINNEVKTGGSVVAQIAADHPPATPAPVAVDVVTTATCANNLYLMPMSVQVPPQQKKS